MFLTALWFNAQAQQHRTELVKKINGFTGPQYRAASNPGAVYGEQPEPDALLYSYGKSYVIEFIFATDETLSAMRVFPESMLHPGKVQDISGDVELSSSQMESLVNIADQLQPLGKIKSKAEPPSMCFQSGRNVYCVDDYEHGVVSHNRIEEFAHDKVQRIRLTDLTIGYKKLVSGTVVDIRRVKDRDSERDLKIGVSWYRISKNFDDKLFKNVRRGSNVTLTTTACSGHQKKVCHASAGSELCIDQDNFPVPGMRPL